jgi:hypothetical protein
LALSQSHPADGGVEHVAPAEHEFSVELCVVLLADIQRMQSPGSIFGFAGVKTSPPLPNKTVGVRGAARCAQAAGVPPIVQFDVTHSFTASAGQIGAGTVTARARSAMTRGCSTDTRTTLRQRGT